MCCLEPTALGGQQRLWADRWHFKASDTLPVVLKLTWNRQAVKSWHLQHAAKCPSVPLDQRLGRLVCSHLKINTCIFVFLCVCARVRAHYNECRNVSLCNRWYKLLRVCHSDAQQKPWICLNAALAAAAASARPYCVCECVRWMSVCGQLYGLTIVAVALSRCGLNNELGK